MAEPGWNRTDSPFHRGELAIQQRLGVRERMERQGRRVIRPVLTDQHRKFFALLPYVLVGSVDDDGAPWASILVGDPGFISAPDPHTLHVGLAPLQGDPLATNLREGSPIGLLGIELATRRRNRVNGALGGVGPEGFSVLVEQTFGNCPQYIQARHANPKRGAFSGPGTVEVVHRFGAAEESLLQAADTFFIATAYIPKELNDSSSNLSPEGTSPPPGVGGVDVSHRGGRPGFVKLTDERSLTIPDYSGNNHFNTFGNLEMNPRAGLLFLDFRTGDLLHLTGTAGVVWEGDEILRFPGAERLLRFQLDFGYRLKDALPFDWSDPEFSPFLEGSESSRLHTS